MTNTSFGLSMVPEWQNLGNFVWVLDLGFVVCVDWFPLIIHGSRGGNCFLPCNAVAMMFPPKLRKCVMLKKKTENMSGHC